MPRLFFGNFDFEHELALSSYSASNSLRRLNAELSWHLSAFAAADDVVLLPEMPTSQFMLQWAQWGGGCRVAAEVPTNESFTAEVWGWSQQVRAIAERRGCAVVAPAIDAVRRANSRRCSFEIEERLQFRLPGSFVVTDMQQLVNELSRYEAGLMRTSPPSSPRGSNGLCASRIRTDSNLRKGRQAPGTRPGAKFSSRHNEAASPGSKWLIKAEFGMSARERVVGRGTELDRQTRGWLEKRLARREWLVFEPFLDRIAEAGILLDVPPITADARPIQVVACTELLTDERGQYLGTRVDCGFAHEQSPQNDVVTKAISVADELRQSGYFGPLGIDAMQYRVTDANGVSATLIRPIQDINARRTMGFVATALARRLAPAKIASWVLLPTSRLCQRLKLEPTLNAEAESLNASGLDLTASLLGASSDVQALRTSPFVLGATQTKHVGVLLAGESRDAVARAEAALQDAA